MATVNINADNFEETIEQNDIVIVDFWAEWCAPCKSFLPIYEEVSEKYEDVIFGKVDTAVEKELAKHFRIMSIPSVMIFREKVVLYSQPGMLTAQQLEEVIGKIQDVDMAAVHAEVLEKEQAEQS